MRRGLHLRKQRSLQRLLNAFCAAYAKNGVLYMHPDDWERLSTELPHDLGNEVLSGQNWACTSPWLRCLVITHWAIPRGQLLTMPQPWEGK